MLSRKALNRKSAQSTGRQQLSAASRDSALLLLLLLLRARSGCRPWRRASEDARLPEIDECIEKTFSTSIDNAECIAQFLVDSVTKFDGEINRQIQTDLERSREGFIVFMERRRQNRPEFSEVVEGLLRVGYEDSQGDQDDAEYVGLTYTSPCCPRIWFLASNYGLSDTARMLLRYETLGTGSLQWGDPVTVHHALYDLMGVRYEGFASPLNSKLLGKPGAGFCSLFRDTDAPFGSLGDFFAVDFSLHPGGWTVNPPFIEELMLRVADKILDHLDRDISGSNWFFVTFPQWEDCLGWQKLAKSPFRLEQLDLAPMNFTVQAAGCLETAATGTAPSGSVLPALTSTG